MTIAAHYSARYFGISLAVISAAFAPALLAQGGRTLARPVGATTAASPESSRLEAARGIVHTLVGTWRFEIWFAGNFGAAPDVTGTRVVTTLYDDLRVQWTEALDHSQIETRGIIGFDPGSGRFFWSSVSSAAAAPEFMIGTLDPAEPLVTFRPITDSADRSFAVTMLDDDHFRSAALDHSWRAVFTRQSQPVPNPGTNGPAR
ncbi:MAG TPA: hypothetical protein VM716_07570 [Gemmatimonadales bacterium]|nr:hypothetical protein [Gemmatimonadales bacterium]